MLKKSEAISKLNLLGAKRRPFSFYCDFPGENWCIQQDSREFQLEIDSESKSLATGGNLRFEKYPIPFDHFKSAFDRVVHEINVGNSFLTNLTFQTPISTNLSLEEIFQYASARYKLIKPNHFVVFSPETFVRIKDDHIFSFPMKGTIDSSLPDARKVILTDEKEKAEHITIVDLIRNDLSQVAEKVEVLRFRYIDEVHTSEKTLLQVSSEIRGSLSADWQSQLGYILTKLLPAGSISGAPKPETIRIIRETEAYSRGYYTGICGKFDGKNLDSGVMIRFIVKEEDQLFYCSGGGITSFSDADREYQEMIDKVYLPIQTSDFP